MDKSLNQFLIRDMEYLFHFIFGINSDYVGGLWSAKQWANWINNQIVPSLGEIYSRLDGRGIVDDDELYRLGDTENFMMALGILLDDRAFMDKQVHLKGHPLTVDDLIKIRDYSVKANVFSATTLEAFIGLLNSLDYPDVELLDINELESYPEEYYIKLSGNKVLYIGDNV